MARLRGPDGCPWDRRQTHASLLKHFREETGEVCRAVRRKDWDNLREELGDIILHVLFQAQIAREAGTFDIGEVLGGLKAKLVRRHPHVFGKGPKEQLTPAEVKRRWEQIKKQEKSAQAA